MSKKIDQIYEILQRDQRYHPQQEGNSEYAARIAPEVEPEPLPRISPEAAKGAVVPGVKESAGFEENDLDFIQDLEILNVIEYRPPKTEDVLQTSNTSRQIPPVTYIAQPPPTSPTQAAPPPVLHTHVGLTTTYSDRSPGEHIYPPYVPSTKKEKRRVAYSESYRPRFHC